MMVTKKIIFLLLSFFLFASFVSPALAEETVRFRGKVTNSVDGKPVEMASIIVMEARVKAYTDSKGEFDITVPAPGTYTVYISSTGMQQVRTQMELKGDTVKNFVMGTTTVKGRGLTVTGEKDKQKISRTTMSVQTIKEVPATFGDSLNALTALPNVTRAWGGMFGPMVIRGADPASNGYFIDGIPMYDPMHFGGIHSVINNDLMKEVDLYSSAFPAQFGQAQSAIINITTLDEVDRFGGNAELGLISSALLLKSPVTETKLVDGKETEETRGYVIAAGRIGYLPLLIRPIYKFLTGSDVGSLPYYGDYQVKAKYFLNKDSSLTFLMFGNADYIDAVMPDEDEKADPLMVGAEYRDNSKNAGQGVTYTYMPSDQLKNETLLFASLMMSDRKMAIEKSPQPELAKGVNIKSRPYIFGLKDTLKMEWLHKVSELRLGFDYLFYYYRTGGQTVVPKENFDIFDPAKSQFETVKLGETAKNHSVGGYVENKFTFGGLQMVPGVRVEYFSRGNQSYADPRGMISYTFPSDTTISAASGMYSYFLQESPYYFKEQPEAAKIDYVSEQKSVHNSLAVEQKYLGLWKTKVEGFYNYFYDLVQLEHYTASNGEKRFVKNCGKLKTYGLEITQSLDLEEGKPGVYGWVSYTLDQSKFRSGARHDDPKYWNKWLDSYYEIVHTIKLVAAYTKEGHTIGFRFTFNTSAPYTPIVGGEKDETYKDPKDPKHERWVPVEGTRNSKRYPPDYRLDVRYSYKSNYEWGYTTWYIEAINVTNKKSVTQEWDYRYKYSKKNPTLTKGDQVLVIIPNFGVEVKF